MIVLCSIVPVLTYTLIVQPLRTRSSHSKEEADFARRRHLAAVLGMVLIPSSIVCLIGGAGAVEISARAINWPQTEGVVLRSDYWRRAMADGQQQYIVTITYEY